ncbi:hypothetical protein SUDANB135_00176 [Streptomyces sp. SudanB135_2055]
MVYTGHGFFDIGGEGVRIRETYGVGTDDLAGAMRHAAAVRVLVLPHA